MYIQVKGGPIETARPIRVDLDESIYTRLHAPPPLHFNCPPNTSTDWRHGHVEHHQADAERRAGCVQPIHLNFSSFGSGSPLTHPPTTLLAGLGGQDGAPKPASNDKKRIYLFHEGRKEDKAILGGKGANLCEVCSRVYVAGTCTYLPDWTTTILPPQQLRKVSITIPLHN